MNFKKQRKDLEALEQEKTARQIIQERYFKGRTVTTKGSILYMVRGVAFVPVVMLLDYTLRRPDVHGLLRTLLNIGFGIATLATLQILYGLYTLIKYYGFKEEQDDHGDKME